MQAVENTFTGMMFWHGGTDPNGYRMKWAFIAIDRFGNDYYSEAVIESVPIHSDEDN